MRAPGLLNPTLVSPKQSGLIFPGRADFEEIKQVLKRNRFSNKYVPETIDTSVVFPGAVDPECWGGVLLANMEDIVFVPMAGQTIYKFNIYSRQFTVIQAGLSGGSKYRGGALHPDGTVYFAPFANGHVGTLVGNTFTEDATQTPVSVNETTKYEGIVVANDGNMYAFPHDERTNYSPTDGTYSVVSNVATIFYPNHGLRVSDNVEIDYVTGTTGVVQSNPITEVPDGNTFKVARAVGNITGTCRIGASRKILRVSQKATQGVAPALANTGPLWLGNGSNLSTSRFKSEGTTLGAGGRRLYGSPLWENSFPVYDIGADTLTRYGNFVGGNPALNTGFGKYRGAVMAWNDWIYFGLFSTDRWAKIHAYTNEFQLFGASYATNGVRGSGMILGPNGLIYSVPRSSSTIDVIDPATDTIRGIPHGYGSSNNWSGGVLAPDGKIYCAPFNAGHMLIIDTGIRDFPREMCLSPYLNCF